MCVVLGLQVPTPALEDPDAGAFTPFQAGAQGGIVVPVTVDGQGPFHFLLDTGSTHSSISDAVADAVGAPAVARATVSSAIGGGVRTVVRLGRLQLGPIVATGVMPSVMRLDGIDSERTIDGVIGQDVLAPLRYAIDFRNRRLVWLGDAAAPEDGGSTFTLEPTNGRFVVRLPQQASVLRLGARQRRRDAPAVRRRRAPASTDDGGARRRCAADDDRTQARARGHRPRAARRDDDAAERAGGAGRAACREHARARARRGRPAAPSSLRTGDVRRAARAAHRPRKAVLTRA